MAMIRKVGSGPLKHSTLLYGPFGAGKNLFSCGAGEHPDMGPVLVVNIEGGTITASNAPNVMETEQLFTVSDVNQVFWDLANGTDEFADFKTVVVDSGSALAQISLMECAKATAKANKSALRMSQQDYGDSGTIVLDLLRRFRNLNKHCIVLAGMREDYDVATPIEKLKKGAAAIGPDFPPALCKRLEYVFDNVWCLRYDENGTRQLLTQPDGLHAAKTRGKEFSEALGAVISDPNLPEIFTLYKETQGKA